MNQEIKSYGVLIRHPNDNVQLRLLYAYSPADAVEQAAHEIRVGTTYEVQLSRVVEVGPAKSMRLKHEGND